MGNNQEGLVNTTNASNASRNSTPTNMLGNEEVTTTSPSLNAVTHGFHSDPEMTMKVEVVPTRTRTRTPPLTQDSSPSAGIIDEQECAYTEPLTVETTTTEATATGELTQTQTIDTSTTTNNSNTIQRNGNTNTIHHNGITNTNGNTNNINGNTNNTPNTNVNHSSEPQLPPSEPLPSESQSLPPSRSPVELEPSSPSSFQPSERCDPRRVSTTSTTHTSTTHTTDTATDIDTPTDTLTLANTNTATRAQLQLAATGKRKRTLADTTFDISNETTLTTADNNTTSSNITTSTDKQSGEATTEEAGLSLLFAASLLQQPPPSAAGSAASTSTPTTANMLQNQNGKNIQTNISVTPKSQFTNPERTDVLCGRGGQINKHVGNIVYRRVVEFNKAVYKQVPKQQRCLVSQSIVQTVVNHGGRFLQQEESESAPGAAVSQMASNLSILSSRTVWKEIPFRRAVQKTSQALREPATPATASGSNSSADGAADDGDDGVDDDGDGADDTEPSTTDCDVAAAAAVMQGVEDSIARSIAMATTPATAAGDDGGEVTTTGATATGEASGEHSTTQKEAPATSATTSTATFLVSV
jgi:hypothetical protein